MESTPLKITISPPVQQPSGAPAVEENSFFGEDGFSFKDVLDAVNPLQQLPIVSTIYRSTGGDSISSASRLIGGTLFGGPIGFILALINEIVQSATGSDIGSNAMAMLEDKETELAQAQPTYAPSPTNQSAYAAYLQMQEVA